jgi:hypothetical protein
MGVPLNNPHVFGEIGENVPIEQKKPSFRKAI